MTANPAAHLDDVALKQLLWKQPETAAIASRILNRALVGYAEFYVDEIALEDIRSCDKNAIGTCFRLLANQGMIAQTGRFRKSRAENAHGRTIFGYTLLRSDLARALLQRMSGIAHPNRQTELPL